MAQRCSDCAAQPGCARVLIVGAERPDEFRDALRIADAGGRVWVVNPRSTPAAARFRACGGEFIRRRIEDLPLRAAGFDLICEHYPYPSGRHYVRPWRYVVQRLKRLAAHGRWILFTENCRLAKELIAAVKIEPELAHRFRVCGSRISAREAPPSRYPPVARRYRLIFERLT